METIKINKNYLLILSLVFLIGIIGVIHGAVISNEIIYDKNDLRVTIPEGNFELKSHSSVNEIKKVNLGNQIVMYYDFNFNDIYKNGLGEVTFTNERNGKLVNRNWKYVYFGNETRQRDFCFKNGLTENGTEGCLIYKKEDYQVETWLPYNSKDIPKGNIRIGIEVEVKKNDYIDGIWNIAGRKIIKHSHWTASDIDIHSPTNMTSNSAPSPYATFANAPEATEQPWEAFDGIESYASRFQSTTTPSYLTLDVGAVNEFVPTNLTLYDGFAGGSAGIRNATFLGSNDNSTWTELTSFVNRNNAIGNTTFNFSENDVSYRYYMLNVTADYGAGVWASSGIYIWGAEVGGNIDITLTSPDDNEVLTSSSITLNSLINITTPGLIEVSNVSLYLNGTLNETNTSGLNGVYSFSKTLSPGIWNWTIKAIDNNSISYNSLNGTLEFNISLQPDIDVISLYPETGQVIGSSPVIFNSSITPNIFASITNVSLLINNSIAQTNTSGIAGYYEFSQSLAIGVWNYSFIAYDNYSNIYTSSNGTIQFTRILAPPTLITPLPNFTMDFEDTLIILWTDYFNNLGVVDGGYVNLSFFEYNPPLLQTLMPTYLSPNSANTKYFLGNYFGLTTSRIFLGATSYSQNRTINVTAQACNDGGCSYSNAFLITINESSTPETNFILKTSSLIGKIIPNSKNFSFLQKIGISFILLLLITIMGYVGTSAANIDAPANTYIVGVMDAFLIMLLTSLGYISIWLILLSISFIIGTFILLGRNSNG